MNSTESGAPSIRVVIGESCNVEHVDINNKLILISHSWDSKIMHKLKAYWCISVEDTTPDPCLPCIQSSIMDTRVLVMSI